MPLYLAWGGHGTAETLKPFADAFADATGAVPAVVDVSTGKRVEPLGDSGYRAVAALTRCALGGTPLPAEFRDPGVDRYYPSTLRALVLIAAHQTFPKCS